jgi:cytochrome c556
MKAMGAAAKAIHQQLEPGAPDAAVIKAQSAKILAGAKDLPAWFPAGSGKSAAPKSHALPVIWTDPAGFDAKAKDLLAAAQKLDAVGQPGDAAAVGAAFKGVGAACKGCHEKYQEKDNT